MARGQTRRVLRSEKLRIKAQRSGGSKNLKKNLEKHPRRPSSFLMLARILGFGGVFLLSGLVAATYFTPLLAIEKIQVVGAERLDESVVQAGVAGLIGRPLTTVSEAELELLLSDMALIETFSMQAQPPHTLTIRIRERQPVAIIEDSKGKMLFDAAGIKIGPKTKKDEFPLLLIPGNKSDGQGFESAVEILLSMPIETYSQVFSIQLSKSGSALLRLRDENLKVVWGDASEPKLKAEVLRSLLKNQEKPGVTIDITSPTSPVITYADF